MADEWSLDEDSDLEILEVVSVTSIEIDSSLSVVEEPDDEEIVEEEKREAEGSIINENYFYLHQMDSSLETESETVGEENDEGEIEDEGTKETKIEAEKEDVEEPLVQPQQIHEKGFFIFCFIWLTLVGLWCGFSTACYISSGNLEICIGLGRPHSLEVYPIVNHTSEQTSLEDKKLQLDLVESALKHWLSSKNGLSPDSPLVCQNLKLASVDAYKNEYTVIFDFSILSWYHLFSSNLDPLAGHLTSIAKNANSSQILAKDEVILPSLGDNSIFVYQTKLTLNANDEKALPIEYQIDLFHTNSIHPKETFHARCEITPSIVQEAKNEIRANHWMIFEYLEEIKKSLERNLIDPRSRTCDYVKKESEEECYHFQKILLYYEEGLLEKGYTPDSARFVSCLNLLIFIAGTFLIVEIFFGKSDKKKE